MNSALQNFLRFAKLKKFIWNPGRTAVSFQNCRLMIWIKQSSCLTKISKWFNDPRFQNGDWNIKDPKLQDGDWNMLKTVVNITSIKVPKLIQTWNNILWTSQLTQAPFSFSLAPLLHPAGLITFACVEARFWVEWCFLPGRFCHFVLAPLLTTFCEAYPIWDGDIVRHAGTQACCRIFWRACMLVQSSPHFVRTPKLSGLGNTCWQGAAGDTRALGVVGDVTLVWYCNP